MGRIFKTLDALPTAARSQERHTGTRPALILPPPSTFVLSRHIVGSVQILTDNFHKPLPSDHVGTVNDEYDFEADAKGIQYRVYLDGSSAAALTSSTSQLQWDTTFYGDSHLFTPYLPQDLLPTEVVEGEKQVSLRGVLAVGVVAYHNLSLDVSISALSSGGNTDETLVRTEERVDGIVHALVQQVARFAGQPIRVTIAPPSPAQREEMKAVLQPILPLIAPCNDAFKSVTANGDAFNGPGVLDALQHGKAACGHAAQVADSIVVPDDITPYGVLTLIIHVRHLFHHATDACVDGIQYIKSGYTDKPAGDATLRLMDETTKDGKQATKDLQHLSQLLAA